MAAPTGRENRPEYIMVQRQFWGSSKGLEDLPHSFDAPVHAVLHARLIEGNKFTARLPGRSKQF